MENTLSVIKTDVDGRPLELAPGTSATYGFMFWPGGSIEECLAWVRSEFAADAAAEASPEEEGEYALTVTVPASHHLKFREYLDLNGWEEEIPEGWTRQPSRDELLDRLREAVSGMDNARLLALVTEAEKKTEAGK